MTQHPIISLDHATVAIGGRAVLLHGRSGSGKSDLALRLIDRAPHISLLFSDVVMPELTGHELAARARAKLPGLRVLLTSGYAPETARVAGETILAKPFDLDRLATAVRAALDN